MNGSSLPKKQVKSLPWKWLAVACLVVSSAIAARYAWKWATATKPIRVGLLHSLNGPMAISEKSMVDAEILAIEQLNAQGGLLNRQIEYVVADGNSDWPTFGREAERLIRDEKVDVIIGCWTSASRKMVMPVVEANNHMLIYPMAYEGLEQSPNIIYTGSAPNQQIIPSISWAMRFLKARRFYLVGSDYIWPHCVNEIAKDALKSVGAEVAGENYLFFGTKKVDHVIQEIVASKPDVIISTVVGDTNKPFYEGLARAGIKASQTPVISFSIAEDELRTLLKEMSADDLVGHYSAWNYFQSIDRPENKAFVDAFRAKYGQDRTTNDVITASYNSVFLWAQAVKEAETTSVEDVKNAMSHQSLDAPEGIVTIDAKTNHTWRPVYIAKAGSDGQFTIEWTSDTSIRPVPFPLSRSRENWDDLLISLYRKWGQSWANPVDDSQISPSETKPQSPQARKPLATTDKPAGPVSDSPPPPKAAETPKPVDAAKPKLKTGKAKAADKTKKEKSKS